VTFTIAVTNTGDVTLTGVTVGDVLATDCITTIGQLTPAASTSYQCVETGVTADFTNVAVVTGTPPVGPVVTDTDTADVMVITPSIALEKLPDAQTMESGTAVTFTIRVTNTGQLTLTGVTVGDVLATDCITTIGQLTPAASTSYQCVEASVTADFTNVAVVTGTSPGGTVVTDTDTADVTVITPSITLEKLPDSQTVESGTAVTFTIRVTNTGQLTLTGVTVGDVLATDCITTVGQLTPAASTSYQCVETGVTADFTNVAVVTGTSPGGTVVTDTDTADVMVITPSITLEKLPDSQTVVSGDTVTFTIRVTNTGQLTLTGVTVGDVLATDCITTIGQLTPAASTSYQCVETGVTADFTNVAVVTGTSPGGTVVTDTDSADVFVIGPDITLVKLPDNQTILSGETVTFTIQVTNTGDVTLTGVTVGDMLVPNCVRTIGVLTPTVGTSYECTRTNVTADLTNVAVVTGTPPVGPVVTDTDTANVNVITPSIVLEKLPDNQTVVSGSTVTFTIWVTNTGDALLSPAVVTDTLAPNCNRTISSLGVGVGTSYTCTRASVTADFTNMAAVTGTAPGGYIVTDTDTADVTVITPSITLEKLPDIQTVDSGSTVTFTVVVTNTGNVTLTGVTVGDVLVPNCVRTIGVLTPTVGTSYECTRTNVTADFTNVAVATGTPPVGPVVTDTDTADVNVIAPDITLLKLPDTQTVVSGATVTFTIAVTNTGDVTLTGVTVGDVLAPNCVRTIGVLTPTVGTSYECTRTNVTADFTNVAVVTGTPPVGPVVTDTDTADVRVITPSITLEKLPDSQIVVSGDTVTFTIQVTNTGNVTLTGVTVGDVLAPNCATTIGTLTPTVGTSYECTRTNVTADFTNVAVVTGTPPVGPVVTDTDTADVTVITPSITLEKLPDTQTVVSGATVTFTIQVTNTGDVTLTGVTVGDVLVPNCATTIGVLTPTMSTSYECTRTNVTADFTNVAVVTGTPPVGPVVTDTDIADVTVITPSITLEKLPDSQTVGSGDTVTFTVIVTNTGSVTLTNVTVGDVLVPNCTATIGVLTPTVGTSYECTRTNVTADFTNVAVVTGTPPVGPVVTDTDTADVTVVTPSITLVKLPDSQTIESGSTVTFTIVVTNTGSVTLTNVTVGDMLVPNCATTIGVLTPTVGTSYECTRTNVTADFTNVAVVTGTPPVGPVVTDTDTADVDVVVPDITLLKLPDNQTVESGGTVTFTIVVTNTGDVTLTNVTVGDVLVPNCATTIGVLSPTVGTSYECTRTNVTADFTNVAVVTGTPPSGPVVTDTDTADVVVLVPSILVGKQVTPGWAAPNMPFTYTIRITNTGQVTFTNTTLTDTLPPEFNYITGSGSPSDPDSTTGSVSTGLTLAWQNLGTLNPSASIDVSFAVTVTPGVTGTFINAVTATGITPITVVSDTADVPVIIDDPAVVIDKQVVGIDRDILAPNYVTFTIVITNVGPSAIGELPMVDHYDPFYLTFDSATPAPDSVDPFGGVLTWNDLTGPAPNGFNRNLPIGDSFSITTIFRIAHDINVTTTNVVTVTDPVDIYENPANDDDDEEDVWNEGDPGIPTPVELLYFRAVVEESAVRLEWGTGVELGTVGFYVYRAPTEHFDKAQIVAYVPATGSGSAYNHTDRDVVSGQRYWYWLVEVVSSGNPGTFGPVQGGVGIDSLPHRLYMPLILNNTGAEWEPPTSQLYWLTSRLGLLVGRARTWR
jgi:uncharacterized repeat protein (TIGR01451 family)